MNSPAPSPIPSSAPSFVSVENLPRIARPNQNRSVAEFAAEAGEAMRDQREWFNHHGEVAFISKGYRGEIHRPLELASIGPRAAITALEHFIRPGRLIRNRRTGFEEFAPRTLDHACTAKLLKSPEFINRLPKLRRILDMPVPIVNDGVLTFPKRGYDEQFQTYCDPDAPEPHSVPLNKALPVLEEVHTDFLWQHDHNRVHALARLITPYCRGLMGWEAKVPLCVFTGDVGKDYLASMTEMVYQGAFTHYHAFDMRSAIGASLRAGHRRKHVMDTYKRPAVRALAEAVTSRDFCFKDRGRDVVLPMELELSVSADFSAVVSSRTIQLIRLIQIRRTTDWFNSRKFKYPNLRERVRDNRAQVLGAIKSLVDHWIEKGSPTGPSTLAGFPEWSHAVGGVMHLNGMGDPCVPLGDN